MKLSAAFLLLPPLLSAVLGMHLSDFVSAQKRTALAAVEPRTISWPGSSAAYRLRRRRGELTNAQRLQRGLTPLPPRKLYQARIDRDLAKRIAGAPANARASGSINVYNFLGCFEGFGTAPGFNVFTIVYTSLEDLANQCAAQQDQVTNAGTSRQYIIFDAGPENPNCAVDVTPDRPEGVACVAGDANGAIYSLAP